MDDYNGNVKGSSRKRSWGSKNLIEFLESLGRDVNNKISENDVTTIITNYIRENPLMANKRKAKTVACDERLRLLFERREINIVKLPDLVAKHYCNRLYSSEDNEQLRLSSSDETITAIVRENIKLLYLRKSLVQELAKTCETFESKVVGAFVRIKNPYQLVQVTGVKEGNPVDGHLLQVSNYSYYLKDVTSSVISDDDFSQVDMEEKLRSLHEDVTKHSKLLREVPEVVGEELEPECGNNDDFINPNCEASSFEAHQSGKEQQLSDSPVLSIQESLRDGENEPTSAADITRNKDSISEEVEVIVLDNSPQAQPNPIEIIQLIDDEDDHSEDKKKNRDDQHCDPTKVLWFYELPKGQTQGPFSITDLKKWNDDEYFAEIPDFKVWMRGESVESAVPLTKLLSYIKT